jgi:hypothetical protein
MIYEQYSLHLPASGLAAKLFGVPLLLKVNAPLAEERTRSAVSPYRVSPA